MRALIRGLDALLRRATGVYEFSAEPGIILRLQIARAPHALPLPGGEVPAGEPVLLLHLWNERMPPIPRAGPELGWAARTSRQFAYSLRAVAEQMGSSRRLAGIRAVGGVTILFFPGDRSGGERLMRRLGFTLMPWHLRLGRFGEFWENLYSWALLWTYNVASMNQRQLLALRRAEFWMPVDDFLRRYGQAAPARDRANAQGAGQS